jgi:hypothetical protein
LESAHDSHTRLTAVRDDDSTTVRDLTAELVAFHGARHTQACAIVEAIWPTILDDLRDGALAADEDAVVLVGEVFERRFPRLLRSRHFAVVHRYTAIAIALVQNVSIGDQLACAPSHRPYVDLLVDVDEELVLLRLDGLAPLQPRAPESSTG